MVVVNIEKKDINDEILKSPSLCVIPWIHLNFMPTGKVIPCCMIADYSYIIGDLKNEGIKQIWNSQKMKTLRKLFIEGKEPIICQKCFDKERATGDSHRIFYNMYWQQKLKEIPTFTNPDGYCKKIDLKYWDFRFSNLCNFKCRTCCPSSSSTWAFEQNKPKPTEMRESVSSIDKIDQKPILNFLKQHIKNVEKIYFAGGEPLLSDEHYDILEMLTKTKRYDVILQYNTNLSILEHNGLKVLDYWTQWKPSHIILWPSIDEIDKRAELIRKGTIWSKIEQNLNTINQYNFSISPTITTSALNVFRLPEIICHLKKLDILQKNRSYKNFRINLLEVPRYYHVCVLSNKFKREIKIKIKNFISDFQKNTGFNLYDNLDYIIKVLDTPHEPENARLFIKNTLLLDTIRKEDTQKTIPELSDVFRNYCDNPN